MTWDTVLMILAGEAGVLTLAVVAYAAVRLAMIALDRKDVGAKLRELAEKQLECESAVTILENRYARISRGRRPAEALPPVEPAPAFPLPPGPGRLRQGAEGTPEERRAAILRQFDETRRSNGGR